MALCFVWFGTLVFGLRRMFFPIAASSEDYEEVGIETAEGEGEEEGAECGAR